MIIELNQKTFTCILVNTFPNGPTHKKGHTLDLIITRAVDELGIWTEIRDPMLSDHSAVHCKLRLKKPPPERKEISCRKLHSVNMDSFSDDLSSPTF